MSIPGPFVVRQRGASSSYAADMPGKPVLRPDPGRWNFERDEEKLAAAAGGSLDCLEIARLSAGTLADTLLQVPAPARRQEPSAVFYRQVAVLRSAR